MRNWLRRLIAVSVVLVSVMIFEGATAFAGVDFVIDDRGYLREYRGNDDVVVISDTVRIIGDYAFAYNKTIVEVIICDGVTYIGNGAFNYCGSIPKNV